MSRGCSCVQGSKFNLVAEAAKVADKFAGALAYYLRNGPFATLFISHTFVQDLPCDTAHPMGDRPDRFEVSDPPCQAPVQNLEDAALGLNGGVCGLTQNVPHLPVAFR